MHLLLQIDMDRSALLLPVGRPYYAANRRFPFAYLMVIAMIRRLGSGLFLLIWVPASALSD